MKKIIFILIVLGLLGNLVLYFSSKDDNGDLMAAKTFNNIYTLVSGKPSPFARNIPQVLSSNPSNALNNKQMTSLNGNTDGANPASQDSENKDILYQSAHFNDDKPVSSVGDMAQADAANPNKDGLYPTAPLKCLIWGPLSDDNLTKAKLLIETYDEDFKKSLKEYEFNKKKFWYVVTRQPVPNKEKQKTIKSWSNKNLGINVEKIVFLDDDRAWINTFTDEALANNYIEKLNKQNIDVLLVPDEKGEVYYYMVEPKDDYVARMKAFGIYFKETSTVSSSCVLDEEQNKNIFENKLGQK